MNDSLSSYERELLTFVRQNPGCKLYDIQKQFADIDISYLVRYLGQLQLKHLVSRVTIPMKERISEEGLGGAVRYLPI